MKPDKPAPKPTASPGRNAPDPVAEQADGTDEIRRRAAEWGLPWVDRFDDAWFEPALVERIPVDWARTHGMLPVRRDGCLCVLTRDPAPGEAIQGLALVLGQEPQPLLAPEALIRSAIDRCYARRGAHALGPSGNEPDGGGPVSAAPATEDLLRMAEGAPVSQRVNLILLEALRQGASDVHIEPQDERLRVRYRIDGLLYDQPAPPRGMEAALVSRLKVMARLDIAERRLPQDGMARVSVGEREIDLRVSTVPAADGERMVLRLLHRESTVLPLGDLGMDTATADRIRSLLLAPQGMILVTGPTGSGKTTTLYAALQELDTQRLNVMTIEDPIEYRLASVSQLQVSPRIGLTFARCLRHVLRQDPDVILVGETRDLETAEIAVRASLTGHLVFTTLHTNSAAAAPARLVDMGVPPYLLADSLRAVLAQRLVRRLCPACRREQSLTEEDLAGLPGPHPVQTGQRHWTARGCPECLDGYRGRTGLFELLVLDRAQATSLHEGTASDAWRRCVEARGANPLLHDGWNKVLSGETSVEELRRTAGGPAEP